MNRCRKSKNFSDHRIALSRKQKIFIIHFRELFPSGAANSVSDQVYWGCSLLFARSVAARNFDRHRQHIFLAGNGFDTNLTVPGFAILAGEFPQALARAV